MPTNYRRKKIFFRESSQGKYIFSYFIIAGLITVLFTVLFTYLSSNTIAINYDNYNLQLGKTLDILFEKLLIIHGILVLIGGLAIIYFVTRLTHKTIGPIFKIKKTIDQMISGNINSEIILRKNDDCKELAAKLNIFNNMLYSKLNEMEEIVEELELNLENKMSRINSSEDEKEYAELNKLSVQSGKLKVILSHFNLSGNHASE